MRFFNPVRNLSPRLLARLTPADYERELALLAMVRNEKDGAAGVLKMIGIARYAPNSDGSSCEFAVTVDDHWNHRGIVTLLMERLIEAAHAAGYIHMTGSVLAENRPMRTLMGHLDFAAQPNPDDATVIAYAKALAA